MNCKPLRRPQVNSEAADLSSFGGLVIAGGPGSGRRKGKKKSNTKNKYTRGISLDVLKKARDAGKGKKRKRGKEKSDLISFAKMVVKADKPYNPQLNQIKDQMERIRHGMKNKQGDSRKPDKEKLNQLQVRKDRLERVTETK